MLVVLIEHWMCFHVHVCSINLCFFFHILCSYQNVLDDRLRHANLGVVLGAVRLFLHLTEDMPQLQTDVHSRIKSESQSGIYTCIVVS